MNPLLSLISTLATLQTDLRTQFNAALKTAGPIEQIEGGNVALGVIREVDWARERLERIGADLAATLQGADKFISTFKAKPGEDVTLAAARLLEEYEKKVSEDALHAAVAGKTVVLKEDHETALTAAIEKAKGEGRSEAEVEFNATLAKNNLLASRRAEAVSKLGEGIAAGLTDEQLTAEGHADLIAGLESKVTLLKDKNITADARPKVFADLMACAHDEATFSARLEVLLDAAGGSFAASSGAPVPPKVSQKSAAAGSSDPAAKKPVVI